jgi:hypothetical protein
MTQIDKRRYPTSVKQILVRRFNFRMGNLRRLLMNTKALDDDLRTQAEELIFQQMDREQYKHEARLMAEKTGNPGNYWDYELSSAVTEAEINSRNLKAFLGQPKDSC